MFLEGAFAVYRRVLLIAVLAAMPASAVVAQESANWNGGHVGVTVQYGQVEALAIGGWAAWIDSFYGKNKGHVLGRPDGINASVRAGYDAQFGSLVLGAGVEYMTGRLEKPLRRPAELDR